MKASVFYFVNKCKSHHTIGILSTQKSVKYLDRFSLEKNRKKPITITITEFKSDSKYWSLKLPLKNPIPINKINKTKPRFLVFATPICWGTVFKWGASFFKYFISNIKIKENIRSNLWIIKIPIWKSIL